MDEAIYYPGHWATVEPDKAAVIMSGSGETVSYRELDESANQLSHWLRSLGLKPGDHVAFCMENRAEYLPIMWGCHYAGLYYTAVSSRLNEDELSYIINNCGAKAFITSPYKADVSVAVIDSTPNVLARLSVGGPVDGHESFEEAIGAQPTTPLPHRGEAFDMLYSSGTTGRPKGIKNVVEDVPLGTIEPVTSLGQLLFEINHSAVYLSPGPLYHAAPLRFCRGVLRSGGTVVVMERFDAEAAIATIEKYKVTTSQWVPTMFIRMLKLPEDTRTSYDVSSLLCAVHAAAPCPVHVKQQMIEWWGPIIHEYYAGTEGNGFVYCNSEQWLEHPGTVGKAVSGEVHIVDDEGKELPVGEEGGVYFSEGGDFEYHEDEEKTAASRLHNGWTTLGDVGRLDEDGYLYLTDRKAFMIISGGVNIYPQEAENALSMHPKVYDIAVFGIPHDEMGEEVKAVVQPVEMPASDDEAAALERELITYCREQLADVKCPRSIDFRPDLPRHPTGKLYKRLLKNEYWEEGALS